MNIVHLKKAQEFKEILAEGKKWRGRNLSLYVLGDGEKEELRVGLVITKKLYPKAVQRNYIRRRIYSFFKENDQLPGGKVVIKVINNEVVSRKELNIIIKKELELLLQKAGTQQ